LSCKRQTKISFCHDLKGVDIVFKDLNWKIIDNRTAYLLDDIGRLGVLKKYQETDEYEFVSRSDIEISDIESNSMEDAIRQCTEEIHDYCASKINTYNSIKRAIDNMKL